MVLVRCLTGAIVGSLPGIIYLFSTDAHIANNTFAVVLIQIGVTVGTLSFGLAALASTIVAAIKYRGTGHVKANRLKEYLNPDTLPAIPPVNKSVAKSQEPPAVKPMPPDTPVVEPRQQPMQPTAVIPEPAVFEDYDR